MIKTLNVWCLMCGSSPLVKLAWTDKYICEECDTVQTKKDHGL